MCWLHVGLSAEGEHTGSQPTQWAIFPLLNMSLLCWKMLGIPNTPCTFFCAQCLGRNRCSHAWSHLCKACVSQNTPFPSLPFLRRAKLPVAASQAAPTPLPASPGHQQTPLAWAEGPELPETPAIQMKDTKEKQNKGRKAFLAGTQLSDSKQGKKVRTAVCSRAAECTLHSMQPEPSKHISLLLPSGCSHRCGFWDTSTTQLQQGTAPASPSARSGSHGGAQAVTRCGALQLYTLDLCRVRSGHRSRLPGTQCSVGFCFSASPPFAQHCSVVQARPPPGSFFLHLLIVLSIYTLNMVSIK